MFDSLKQIVFILSEIRLHQLCWMFWFTENNQFIRVIIRVYSGCDQCLWFSKEEMAH